MKKTINKVDYICLIIITLYFIFFYSSNYNVGVVSNVDEGFFLNSFYRIYLGQMPYIDFNWIYGPVMLYFFAGLFKIFSVSAITARMGYIILYFAVVILTYFLARKIMPRFFAFTASIMLVGILKVFNVMYPHIGCTLAGLLILIFILKYMEVNSVKSAMPSNGVNKSKYLIWAGIFCGFSLTVKMNIGLAMLVSVCAFFVLGYFMECMVNNKKLELFNRKLIKEILIYVGAALLVSVPVYFYFLRLLNPDQLQAVFPWYSIYHYFSTPNQHFLPTSFTVDAFRLWFINEPMVPLLIRILPLCFVPILFYRLYLKKFDLFEKNILLLMLFMLSISIESFIYLGKIQYAQPVIFISFAYLLFIIEKSLKNKPLKYSFLCALSVFLIVYAYTYSIIPIVKKNIMFGKYMNLKRYHLYVPDSNSYYNFMNVIKYVQDNTCLGDRIFALPFDSFIYFYSERDNATRADSMEYALIYKENDVKNIIKDLKKNKPKLILISNRISMEKNMGIIWGETYQKSLKRFIFDNYHFMKQIGDFKAKNNKEFQENYSCRIYEINQK